MRMEKIEGRREGRKMCSLVSLLIVIWTPSSCYFNYFLKDFISKDNHVKVWDSTKENFKGHTHSTCKKGIEERTDELEDLSNRMKMGPKRNITSGVPVVARWFKNST